jgi:hypothetical protein
MAQGQWCIEYNFAFIIGNGRWTGKKGVFKNNGKVLGNCWISSNICCKCAPNYAFDNANELNMWVANRR